MFYTKNHSFIARSFFFKTFIPKLFPLFVEGRLRAYYLQLIVLVQLRKAHLDITEKLLTGN